MFQLCQRPGLILFHIPKHLYMCPFDKLYLVREYLRRGSSEIHINAAERQMDLLPWVIAEK